MLRLNTDIIKDIKKACKGKKHIKLTVGILSNNEKNISVFNENGEIQNENYIYEIASITKTFTASLLAKYIHENKISLDDSIQKYFDGLSKNTYYPTLKRLATHTAGYSMALPFTWRAFLLTPLKGFPPLPNVDEIKIVLQKNHRKDKDYPWQYSNFGFILLGHVIGSVSGKGYWDTMENFLSNELALQNTYTGTNPEKNLHGYNNKNKDCGNYMFVKSPEIPSGEGDISSTAEDLLKYAEINIHEKKPYISFCHKKHANADSMSAAFLCSITGIKGIDMGLGWMLKKDNNNILLHSGDSDSFSSFLAIDKEKKLASVILSNYKINTYKIGLSILDYLQTSSC